jgi:hypothetical protein
MVGTTSDMKGRNMSNVGSLGVGTMRSRITRRPIESDDEAAVEDRPSVIAKDAASAAMSSEPRRSLMFAVLVCGTLLTPLDYFIVSVALPSIRSGLGADAAMLQLVISGYAASFAVMLITGAGWGTCSVA